MDCIHCSMWRPQSSTVYTEMNLNTNRTKNKVYFRNVFSTTKKSLKIFSKTYYMFDCEKKKKSIIFSAWNIIRSCITSIGNVWCLQLTIAYTEMNWKTNLTKNNVYFGNVSSPLLINKWKNFLKIYYAFSSEKNISIIIRSYITWTAKCDSHSL